MDVMKNLLYILLESVNRSVRCVSKSPASMEAEEGSCRTGRRGIFHFGLDIDDV